MDLIFGQTFLLFNHATLAGPGIGFTPYSGSVVMTKAFVHFIPSGKEHFAGTLFSTLSLATPNDTSHISMMLHSLVNAPGVSLANLELSLGQYLHQAGNTDCLFKVDELTKFATKTGIFGATRMKRQGGRVCVLEIQGVHEARKMIRQFYGT